METWARVETISRQRPVQTLRVQSESSSDGVLHLDIPVDAPNAFYDVVVVLQPMAREAEPRTPGELGWPPGFVAETAGSIQDPTFRRHEQGAGEKRLEF